MRQQTLKGQEKQTDDICVCIHIISLLQQVPGRWTQTKKSVIGVYSAPSQLRASVTAVPERSAYHGYVASIVHISSKLILFLHRSISDKNIK